MSEAMQRPMAPMPAWLVFSGAAIGIVGASVTEARGECRRTHPRSGQSGGPSNLAAVTPGEWGLGCLSSGQLWHYPGLLSQLAERT